MERQNTKLGMRPFNRKHRRAVDNLLKVVFAVVKGEDPPLPKRRSWALLLRCRQYPDVPLPIEKEEIISQMFIIWKELEEKWYFRARSSGNKREYILGYAIYEIRDWIRQQENNFLTSIELGSRGCVERMPPWWLKMEDETILSGEERSEVYFLFNKKEQALPSIHLSGWERQLIYLNYLMNKSLRDMVPLLQKDRDTLSKQVKRLEEKINRSVGSPTQDKDFY